MNIFDVSWVFLFFLCNFFSPLGFSWCFWVLRGSRWFFNALGCSCALLLMVIVVFCRSWLFMVDLNGYWLSLVVFGGSLWFFVTIYRFWSFSDVIGGFWWFLVVLGVY